MCSASRRLVQDSEAQKLLRLKKEETGDRKKWRRRIHVADLFTGKYCD